MWNKISLYKYKELEKIQNKNVDDLEKSLLSTCVIYGMTNSQFDNLSPRKATRKMLRLSKLLSKEIKPIAKKRVGKYLINYNIDAMTFGQYIELAYFIQNNIIDNAHYICATASKEFYIKFIPEKFEDKHSKKANYFLNKRVDYVIGIANAIAVNFNTFNMQYKGLFGLKNGLDELSDHEASKAQEDVFNKQYGWIFSATQVMKHEGIKLDDAFRLPVKQALNDLAFLKAFNKYQEKLSKKL